MNNNVFGVNNFVTSIAPTVMDVTGNKVTNEATTAAVLLYSKNHAKNSSSAPPYVLTTQRDSP